METTTTDLTNVQVFEKFTPEIQDLLLEIYKLVDLRELKLITTNQYILSEDLDDNIDDIDEDIVIEKAQDLCSGCHTTSKEMYNAIKSDLTFDVDDIEDLIEDNLTYEQKIELFNFFKELGQFKIISIDDEFKIDILTQLFDKYTSYQLEEKVKHLI